jgi:diguanylate cyclase (GGDEF)-like protein/PAS domain S-box-containing protein
MNETKGSGEVFYPGYEGFRAIVADDDMFVPAYIKEVLEQQLGMNVKVVPDGDALLASLQNTPYHVVITNMRMPGINGLDLIHRIREVAPHADIIVSTGDPVTFNYAACVQCGARDALYKPFLSAELVGKVMRILDEQKVRHDLQVAQAKYREVFDSSVDGMAFASADTLVLTEANAALGELLGMRAEEIPGKNLMELIDPTESERFRTWLEYCQTPKRGAISGIRLVRKEGKGVYADISVIYVEVQGETIFYIAFRDVTERLEMQHHIAEAATRDALTGLFNKSSFRARLDAAVNTARAKGVPLVLMMVDLDNFKHCNDTYGHATGDALLNEVGALLRAQLRAEDEAFRFGGDEFGALLYNVSGDVAQRIAERIRSAFANSQTYGTSMSIGLAEYQPGMTPAEWLEAADEALYDAKHKGKNQVALREA